MVTRMRKGSKRIEKEENDDILNAPVVEFEVNMNLTEMADFIMSQESQFAKKFRDLEKNYKVFVKELNDSDPKLK